MKKKMEWGGTAESSETGEFIGGENASSMYKRGGGVKYASLTLKYDYPKFKRQPAHTTYYKIDTSKEVKVGGLGEKGYGLLFKDGNKSNVVIKEKDIIDLMNGKTIESSGAKVSISDKYEKGGGIKTKKDYIEYLNEVGVPEHDHPENEGRVSWAFVNRYGEWLKKNDPVAFEVGYSEWKNGYAKGGGLKGKAKYVPNYMVQSVEVERKGKTTDIDGANILDGVYVKKGVKFAKGGGFDNVDTELIDASAKTIYDKDGMMGLRNKFLVLANTDEKHGDKSTANYRRKVVADYQAKQPKFMAKGGGLETAKISELKKDMIVYPIYGSYAGKKGYVNKIMPDNKTVEVIFKNKVGNEYVKFEGNELTTNLKYLNGGAMNETFPDTDAMSYEEGGELKESTWSYSIGGL